MDNLSVIFSREKEFKPLSKTKLTILHFNVRYSYQKSKATGYIS